MNWEGEICEITDHCAERFIQRVEPKLEIKQAKSVLKKFLQAPAAISKHKSGKTYLSYNHKWDIKVDTQSMRAVTVTRRHGFEQNRRDRESSKKRAFGLWLDFAATNGYGVYDYEGFLKFAASINGKATNKHKKCGQAFRDSWCTTYNADIQEAINIFPKVRIKTFTGKDHYL